jgi:hypothetical protein
MLKKTYKSKEVFEKPREAEAELSYGASVAEVVRVLAISEITCYRWRRSTAGCGSSKPNAVLLESGTSCRVGVG